MTAEPSTTHEFSKYLATGEGVYGLILVSGLIATASSAQASSFRVLLFVAVTLGVFWLAHVYSEAVGDHGSVGEDGEPVLLRDAIRKAVRETKGMIFAAVLPALSLVLGVVGILKDRTANWLALWVCVGVLAILGYRAYSKRGASMPKRLIGALATASFGLIIIAAKAIVTH